MLDPKVMAGRLMKDPARAKAIARETIPALRESVRAKIASKPGAAQRDPSAAAKLLSEAEALAKDPKKAAAKFAEAYAKDPLSYAVGNWGWVLDQGATMIQSDYAAELIVYLMQKGRRNF